MLLLFASLCVVVAPAEVFPTATHTANGVLAVAGVLSATTLVLSSLTAFTGISAT